MPDLSRVMPNPAVVPILWSYDYVVFQTTTELIERMIRDLVTGPFMNRMAQYSIRHGKMVAPIIIDDPTRLRPLRSSIPITTSSIRSPRSLSAGSTRIRYRLCLPKEKEETKG